MKDTENTRALLTHIIRMKQQQRVIGSAISRSIAWARNEKSGKSGEDGGVQMTETRIYIGLNDAGKDTVQGIAKDICTLFHQESVLVTENEIDGYFINRASE